MRSLRQTPGRISIDPMSEYQCWFCGREIEQVDLHAVMISVRNFWDWHADRPDNDAPSQTIFVHSACTKSRMRGATMELDPSTLRGNRDEL
jgi:hypothetical protein